jgi:hypothetical protein|nr:MAG TPA: hypothetical protein [Caudoviricetes sp.]DAP82187.1 MAG TPA: hypothetical protein [Caudoviricetes sp.]
MPEKQKEQLISQSGVLSMGFTKSMIDKLLPPPILKRNPHYASSAPMKLWREDDVRSVMGTQEFQTMAAKAAARKAASAKAVETKRKNAEGIADNLIASIHVTRWDIPVLEEATLNAKQEWFLEHGNVDMATPNTETLERWMVNFVRHNLCEYDDKLIDLFGLVGKEELYHRLKTETLAKIAEVYPELDVECKRQAQE